MSKAIVSAQIPVADLARLDRLAAQTNETRSTLAARILHDALRNVELTPQDYRAIAEKIEANMRKRGTL